MNFLHIQEPIQSPIFLSLRVIITFRLHMSLHLYIITYITAQE